MRTAPTFAVALLIAVAAHANEPAVDVDDAAIDRIVADAPALPVDLELDLNLRLVDFIDATDADTPHPMKDQGTSRIVDGPAGRYRVTAAHRHAFAAWRWRAAGHNQPHLIVFEYPDDAQRQISFFMHESSFSGIMNHDWSLETGVYTGTPFPLTGDMQYHTFIYWPTDDWPVAMAMNFNRHGEPAAVSRIWVYAIEGGLPALDVDDPDPDQPRNLGTFYNWSLVVWRGVFGRVDRDDTFRNLIEYHRYLGQNVVMWPAVSNNTWGFRARIDAWDGDDEDDEIGGLLTLLDEAGMKYIATFGLSRRFTIGGVSYADTDDREEWCEQLFEGFTQFIDRYGHHPSLYGIGFDTPDLSPAYGDSLVDILTECCDGDLREFTAFIHERKPELKIFTLVGAQNLHRPYFANPGEVLDRWQASDQPLQDILADEAHRLWTSWGRDPDELAAVPGLTVMYQYQLDDHAIYPAYSQQPRSMMFFDLEQSREKARLHDTRATMLFNTFFEGYIGLHTNNFWYRKLWVAPDFNPAEPSASAAWATAMLHRDRDHIVAGAWNRKGAGLEASLRRFARAYRALPPIELADVKVEGATPVHVRQEQYDGHTYAAVLNPTPFETGAHVTLGDAAHDLTLAPFELRTLIEIGDRGVTARGEASPDYVAWLEQRLARYDELLTELRELEPAAVDDAFVRHYTHARELLDEQRYHEMDVSFGHALTEELALRQRIVAPPQQRVPRIDGPPASAHDLDAWPAQTADILADSGRDIGTHMWFPASWSGPDDLSVRVRLGHDGERLHFAIHVRDDVLTENDTATLHLSTANYRRWMDDRLPFEHTLALPVPHDADTGSTRGQLGLRAASRRTDDGYIITGSVSLAELGVGAGERVGWLVRIEDHDETPNVYDRAGWARNTVMLVPNSPTFTYWSDARTCGELALQE